MYELGVLKALSSKDNYFKYRTMLNPKTLSIQTIELLKDYAKYFEAYEDSVVDFNRFREFFFISQHPNLDEKSVQTYKEVIERLNVLDLESKECSRVVTAFEQQEFYAELHDHLDKNVDIKTLVAKVEKFSDRIKALEPTNIEAMDVDKALEYTDRSSGLNWRLQSLNDHFGGGLIKGDFLVVSGYVDSGKTSFMCSEVSHFAEQLRDDQWIAWLNTEGNWEQVLCRIYQASLGITKQELIKFREDAKLKYKEKMHGDLNRIKVLNFQRKSTKDVEDLCKKNPPSLIVFDLLDAVSGFDKYLGADGSHHEKYGALYQWARVIATEHCPVIAISQLNRNGNDNPYPMMTELSGSGEKKQGAASAMIMLGSLQGNDTERFLSTPKNKIGGSKSWRRQVKFDPLRSRFSD